MSKASQRSGKQTRNHRRFINKPGNAWSSPAQMDWFARCRAQSAHISTDYPGTTWVKKVLANLGDRPVFEMRQNSRGVWENKQVGIMPWYAGIERQ